MVPKGDHYRQVLLPLPFMANLFVCLFAGAGKTHTMLGQPEDPGVIFQTMMELYRRIDAIKNTRTCKVSVSYCEVRMCVRFPPSSMYVCAFLSVKFVVV